METIDKTIYIDKVYVILIKEINLSYTYNT